ncbi:MAG: hypothetical protein QOH46_668 [Solirubrobacteraceae bacterium]|jgi:hypothetical protein|nr:hypothetical protein [Solirubrobacteraceae bacterium]MEA2246139.1 hypothetical protein [Solirubrobacteraceae bacterium]
MTEDPHSPTTAAPTPQPTPTVPAAGATTVHPVGTAAPSGAGATDELPFGIPPDRPEILVGAAFAGGLLAAIILKRLGSD